MIALISVLTVVHLVVYVTTRNVVEEQIKLNARGVAVAVAHSLMENIEEYELFTRRFLDKTEPVDHEYFQDPYYQRMQALFADVKENGHIKFIATERKISEEHTEYILDAEPEDDEDHSAPGDLEDNIPQREAVFSSKRAVGANLYVDKRWGTLIEGFAPIFDRNGEMLGLVSVSIDASELYGKLNMVQATLFLIYAVIVGMALMTLPKYSDAVLESIPEDESQKPTESGILKN
jgi:sensor histidine kinase regulating citrate/malate metabolism